MKEISNHKPEEKGNFIESKSCQRLGSHENTKSLYPRQISSGSPSGETTSDYETMKKEMLHYKNKSIELAGQLSKEKDDGSTESIAEKGVDILLEHFEKHPLTKRQIQETEKELNKNPFYRLGFEKGKLSKTRDTYIRLNDVLGLFKNRKLSKTTEEQRRRINYHLNKLTKYEGDKMITDKETNEILNDKDAMNAINEHKNRKGDYLDYTPLSKLNSSEIDSRTTSSASGLNSLTGEVPIFSVKNLQKEIEKCSEYKSIEGIRCDAYGDCGEPVEISIGLNASASSDTNWNWKYWKYQPEYHLSWSCKGHGSVPVTINGEPSCIEPLEYLGEMKQVLQAKLQTTNLLAEKVREEIDKRIFYIQEVMNENLLSVKKQPKEKQKKYLLEVLKQNELFIGRKLEAEELNKRLFGEGKNNEN